MKVFSAFALLMVALALVAGLAMATTEDPEPYEEEKRGPILDYNDPRLQEQPGGGGEEEAPSGELQRQPCEDGTNYCEMDGSPLKKD